MYRTGDLARWRRDGRLEYAGRTDHQVKLRGHRIEPGEIQAVLAAHPSVTQTAVILREDTPGDQRLTAYTVTTGQVSDETLHAHAAAHLPGYMIPAAFVTLDALPLTPNGKLDRKALPTPEETQATKPTGRAPRSPREEILCGLYADILGIPHVTIDDDFFRLGGHSLLAIRLLSRIRTSLKTELPIRQLFETPTIAGLTTALDGAHDARTPLTSRERPTRIPLSYAQQRLWFLHQLEGLTPTYNIPIALRLTGKLDRHALTHALHDLTTRHETLRTLYTEDENGPHQSILPANRAEVALPITDTDEKALSQELAKATAHTFDLTSEIPIRAALFRLNDNEHVLLLLLHHIASDAWSITPLARDLTTAYTARCRNQPPHWDQLPVQYADYALWQHDVLGSEEDSDSAISRQLDYWRQQLDGIPGQLDLPTDRPRPAVASYQGDVVSFTIPPHIHERLKGLARDNHSSVFMVIQAAVAALLTRHGAGHDIPIGTPISGRTDNAVEELAGFFLNTLVLRTDTSANPSFQELLRRVRETDLDAYTHQDLPFERLVEHLNPARSLAHHPLFQVMLTVRNAHIRGEDQPLIQLPGLSVQLEPNESPAARFDLSFFFDEPAGEMTGGMPGGVTFSTDLFDADTVRALTDRLLRILDTVTAYPDTPLNQLDILGAEQRQQLLVDWNGITREIPAKSVITQFEEQAARTPDATALSCDGQSLTYAELDARANRLARLLAERGACAERFVAVALPRSLDLVVSLLAVLKTGAAYLPIDPDYPADRITYMLGDADTVLALATEETAPRLRDAEGQQYVRTMLLDDAHTAHALQSASAAPLTTTDLHGPEPTPDSPAYIIYTSGSTGRAKGVVVPLRGLGNFLMAMQDRFTLTTDDHLLSVTTVSFDIAGLEIFLPLLTGAHVTLVHKRTAQEPEALRRLIAGTRATHLQATPSLWRELAAAGALDPGQLHVLVGGEALPGTLATDLHDAGLSVTNLYGPTEATIWATAAELDSTNLADPPIGQPVANTAAYVLDHALNPVAPGVTGELYIAGPQLARGYHQRPGLTAERFIADPHGAPGTRMYRTGDLARWRADGHLEYAGRTDHQVKLRGHRIEPGEIQAVLTAHPAVTQAAVILREDTPGDQRLTAYTVASEAVSDDDLRTHLAADLPDYMVPAAFVTLDALPLTPNGKLDRKALPAPDYTTAGGRAPRTPREEILCNLYADVLDVPQVTIDDDFFRLGGHSLLATRLVSRIRTTLNTELPIRQLFQTPTIAALTTALDSAQGARAPLTARERPERIPLSHAQQRLWFLHQLEGPTPTYNIPTALRLTGTLNHHALTHALHDLTTRHETLRTTITTNDHGPHQTILPADQAVPELTVASVRQEELAEALAQAAHYCFDLSTELPIRATLFRLAEDEHVLLLLLHHIAGDAWSHAPLTRDLTAAYNARLNDTTPAWQPLPIQYADYTLWQHELLGEEADPDSLAARQLAYWAQQLADLPDEVPLPMARTRPAVASQAGAHAEFTVSAELHQQLAALAQQNGASLFMVLQAAIATLLTRLGAGTDIPIGAPIAGRTDDATDNLVGFFINTLVLRTDTSGQPTFRELLNRVRETDLDAYAHQDLPFERLVEHLNPTRTLAHHPLFQVMLILNNTERESLESLGGLLDGLEVAAEGTTTAVARTDLAFELAERQTSDGGPAGLSGSIRYRTDLFDAASVRELTGRFLRLLEGIAEDCDRPVFEFGVLSAEERRTVLTTWNDTAQPLPDATLPELFEDQAARTPGAEALAYEGEGKGLTYAELNARANRLARLLREYGARPERFVALALPRSPLLVTVLLAIAKTGAAYLPIDPDYPHERISYMLRDAGPVLLLTTSEQAAGLPDMPADTALLAVDEPTVRERTDRMEGGNLTVERSGKQLAYAMYTSGSTGHPKGVATTQHGVVALVRDRCWNSEASQRVLFHAPHTFDASTYEIWLPLVTGGTVVIAPPGPLDVAGLTALVTKHDITALHLTAGLFRVIADEAPHCFSTLREVLTGGDVVSPAATATVLRHAPHVTLRHLYGPTETTLCATQHELRAPYTPEPSLPIGRPLDNTQTYVLDAGLRPVPAGVVGELYIAGRQLARGYHQRPGLTADRFPANPYGEPGTRMYRTGDLARWRGDGRLEFLGRADDQIKVRGHRIEPGEIEAALATHPEVAQAAVLLREDSPGDRRLVAYTVTRHDRVSAAGLRAHLVTALPDYMVPAGFVVLESLPLTANGKLDRKALPAPDYGSSATGGKPRSEREKLLAQLFAETLRLDTVGVEDRFFDLGGDSIMSIQLVSRARAKGLTITVRDVFEHQTVAALAQVTADTDRTAPVLPDIGPAGPVPLTPVMYEFLERGGPIAEYNQSIVVATPPSATVETLTCALQALLDWHDSLRLRLAESPDGWATDVLPAGAVRAADHLTHIDATHHTTPEALQGLITHHATQARTHLNPHRAHNLHALYLDHGRDQPAHLVLIAHHLVIDGVSWRILLNDLATLHGADAATKAPEADAADAAVSDADVDAADQPELPAVHTHWRQWATALGRHAETAHENEAEFWSQLPTDTSSLSLTPGRDTYATVHRHSVHLGTAVTDALLTQAPGLYNTTITDVLLSAFTVAIMDWRRSHPHIGRPDQPVVLDLETHGRHEELLPGADLTRTTGWFTNVHPLWFHPRITDWADVWHGGPALGRVVKEVKEQRGAVPEQGIGYGLLRYLSPRTAPRLGQQPAPPYAFNYLGRVTSGADDAPWSITASGVAGTHPDTPLSHPVSLSAVTLDTDNGPELHTTWSYASELIRDEEIEQLAANWTRALEALAAHTQREDAGGLTPSDITYSGLGQAEIDEFEAEFELEEDF